jgi:maleylacetoacetate isomerase
MSLTLYSYFRSSAAFRVRIALNLKRLDHTLVPVSLVLDGGEHLAPAYRAINPAALVPSLEAEGAVLTQSLAIVEYLEERHPEPPLLPERAIDRAWVRALALNIACEIHPLNNLRVLRYLGQTLGLEEEARTAWYRHWVEHGLAAVERLIERSPRPGDFCLGDGPTLADCCLVPQLFNARRFGCAIEGFPRMLAIEARCLQLEAFRRAAPDVQPDAL